MSKNKKIVYCFTRPGPDGKIGIVVAIQAFPFPPNVRFFLSRLILIIAGQNAWILLNHLSVHHTTSLELGIEKINVNHTRQIERVRELESTEQLSMMRIRNAAHAVAPTQERRCFLHQAVKSLQEMKKRTGKPKKSHLLVLESDQDHRSIQCTTNSKISERRNCSSSKRNESKNDLFAVKLKLWLSFRNLSPHKPFEEQRELASSNTRQMRRENAPNHSA